MIAETNVCSAFQRNWINETNYAEMHRFHIVKKQQRDEVISSRCVRIQRLGVYVYLFINFATILFLRSICTSI